MCSGFLHTFHIIDNIALPCFWSFDHGHETLVLVYITDLFIARSALPAFTSMPFFYTGFALLRENHSQTVSLFFNSQGLVPLETFPRPAQRPAAGAPYPCPQVNCIVARQAETAVMLTAVVMVIQCMTKLTEFSCPKYVPDILNTIIMFIM